MDRVRPHGRDRHFTYFPYMNGALVVDKPAGWTSHDVVNKVRRLAGIRKVGHLGTLDPKATGVLPVCIGKATRLARFLASSPKEYTGEIFLGVATTTYDREGEASGPEVRFTGTAEDVTGAMRRLTGELLQIPPAYSAKKIGGEVVNYDSIQIYRGFDIGSAKPSAALRAAVPHHLFDIVEGDVRFTAADFAEAAE